MSVYLTKLNTLRTTAITNIKDESSTVKTFTVQDDLCAKANPGQFLMLWIPGIDEIPLSILNAGEGQVQFTVKAVGDATRHLHTLKTGDILGVRGPFGNSFTETRCYGASVTGICGGEAWPRGFLNPKLSLT